MSGQTSRREPVTVSDAVEENEHARVVNGRLWVDVISGGGSGGTQYNEGDTDSSITGTAIMWEDVGDTLRPVSAATPLPVNIVATVGSGSGDVQYDDGSGSSPFRGTVSMAKEEGGARVRPLEMKDTTHELRVTSSQSGVWNITDILGSVPLPTGAATSANQLTEIASLSVMDDWDESDRAKVNVIVGQAGITAGAGSVAANTPRVTHASDDPVTTSVQIMDDWDESDRAKVNPIVGQAGVQGASGTVSANTQRVVLATDVALPAGNNNIGDVDIASIAAGNNNIGDVDVASVIPGTGATNLGKAVDSAKGATDTGVQMLGIRDDTLSIFSNAENDYEPLHLTAAGRLYTSATVDAALPAGNNNIGDVDVVSQIPGTGATNLGKAVDSAKGATDTGVMALAIRDDTLSIFSNAENDYEPLHLTATGRLYASATVDSALPAGTNNIGDVDIISLPNEGQQTMANSISVAIASDQAAYYFVTTLTSVNTVYDDSPTSATSGAFNVTPWRKFMLSYELVKTSTPTDILITVQFNNGGTWVDYRNDFWGQILYDDVATATKIARAHSGDCVGTQMRVKVVATGTSSTNKFTMTNARVECKN